MLFIRELLKAEGPRHSAGERYGWIVPSGRTSLLTIDPGRLRTSTSGRCCYLLVWKATRLDGSSWLFLINRRITEADLLQSLSRSTTPKPPSFPLHPEVTMACFHRDGSFADYSSRRAHHIEQVLIGKLLD